MKKPNPKKLILAIAYHKVLDKEDKTKLTKHANKIKGMVDHDLPVHSASDSVAYAGPTGIDDWLERNKACAFEVFMDNQFAGEEDEEIEAEFYFDGKELWVWADNKMHTFKEWEKIVQDSIPIDDSEEAYSIADFEASVRNAINTALAAGIPQKQVNEILQDIYNTEVEASDEED